jgi:hypothetical protein
VLPIACEVRASGTEPAAAAAAVPAAAEFVELPGVGHCPQDEAPHLVNPLIEAFVLSSSAASSTDGSSSSSSSAAAARQQQQQQGVTAS